MDVQTGTSWRRVIVPQKYLSEEILPGVVFEQFHPGGINGPNDEVLMETPGGQTFSEQVHLGTSDNDFELGISHIRMPANQVWPIHWHDCWTVVLCLEGTCMVGDWWMRRGDLLIVDPELEYGPLVSGPAGSRLFEIFTQAHLAPGGYAPEYHDHLTLQTLTHTVFKERLSQNQGNTGNQGLSCDNHPGLQKSHVSAGELWNLGDPGDPDRAVMKATRLAPNEQSGKHQYGDWHFVMVVEGSISVAGKTLGLDDYLVIRPDSPLEFQAGPDGATLLEAARTSRGAEPIAV